MFNEVGDFYFHDIIGNDEYTGSGWQRRTAEFTLFLVVGDGRIQTDYVWTRKDVYELKYELIDKYTKWVEQYKKQQESLPF